MAKIDHVLFKKRVVDTVTGHDDWASSGMPDHHHCRLGKWYDAIKNEKIKHTRSSATWSLRTRQFMMQATEPCMPPSKAIPRKPSLLSSIWTRPARKS